MTAFLILALALLAPVAGERAQTLILADPDDTYYALAEEIAREEGLSIAHTLEEVLARDPLFLLWVASPGHLSEQRLVGFGLAQRDRPSAISAGIITGSTLEDARNLWLRALEVKGERVFAANAENPAGHIEAGIMACNGAETTVLPLTRQNLVESLLEADYLTFSGHGGKGFLGLDADTGLELRPEHIPPCPRR